MKNEQCGTLGHEHTSMCYKKRISWTAIIIGALVGIGLGFLLNLFSIAIGLSLVATNKEGMMTIAVGGFIGLLIGTIASMFVAGFTAGYLGRPYCIKGNLGTVYGFAAWSLALILSVILAANISHYISFYADFVSNPTMMMGMATDKNAVMNAAIPANQAMANHPAMTSFLIFVLFFVGALSSCFGGHCGMTCCRDGEDSCSIR